MSNMRITSIEALEQRIDALEKRYEETGIIIAKMFAVLAALRDGGTRDFGTLCSHLERDIMQPAPSADVPPVPDVPPQDETEQEPEDLFDFVAQGRGHRAPAERAGKKWTAEEEKALGQHLSEGLDYKAISEIMGRSFRSLENKANEIRNRWRK